MTVTLLQEFVERRGTASYGYVVVVLFFFIRVPRARFPLFFCHETRSLPYCLSYTARLVRARFAFISIVFLHHHLFAAFGNTHAASSSSCDAHAFLGTSGRWAETQEPYADIWVGDL